MSSTSFAHIDRSMLPAWPKVRILADKVIITGWHRSFRRRMLMYRLTKLLGRLLVVYGVLALIAAVVAMGMDAGENRDKLWNLARLHATTLWKAVAMIWPSQHEAMLFVYFFVPLVLGLFMLSAMRLFDLLLAPLTLSRTTVQVTTSAIIVGGRSYTRGPIGTIEFRVQPYERLQQMKDAIRRRQELRDKEIQKALQNAARKQADARTTDSMMADHERKTREEDRLLVWHEDMRTLQLVCGARLVKIGTFTRSEPAIDFQAACLAAIS